MRQILRLAATALGGVLYVWFAAVRRLPEVRRRKAARRARRASQRAA